MYASARFSERVDERTYLCGLEESAPSLFGQFA